jgi:Cft2 family RNA processing exonuclease
LPQSSASLTPVSGYGGKSPACFLVQIGKRRLLLDLGEDPATGRLPDLSKIGCVDAVLISHGHIDHVGGLRALDRINNPPVYATAMVRALGVGALRTAEDLPLRGSVRIAGIEIETGRSGHTPGAVWMRVGGKAGVLYTGDYSREGALYAFDAPPTARLLILDASYGTYDDPLGPVVDVLVEAATRGPLLLPTQPNGRGLEMAVMLHERGVPISLCPEHVVIAKFLLSSQDEELQDGATKRLALTLASMVDTDRILAGFGAVLAADGSAAKGAARILLGHFLDENLEVIFTSNPTPGTLGARAIKDGSAAFRRWNTHPRISDLHWLVRCVTPKEVMPAFLDATIAKELVLHAASAPTEVPLDL